jgi:lysophospholipase L1-like esterase
MLFSILLLQVLYCLVFSSFEKPSYSRFSRKHRMDSDSEEELSRRIGNLTTSNGKKWFLAFGDSLTEGYYHYGMKFHPYTEKLEELLAKREKEIKESAKEGDHKSTHMEVVNRGNSGETTFQMYSRLENLLGRKGIAFSWIAILGGTNDLASSHETAQTIFGRLLALYNLALSHNNNTAKLIVITIPATAFDEQEEEYLAKKKTINSMIYQFYNEKKEEKRVFYLDLYSAIPYYEGEDKNEKRKGEKWDDRLHLSSKGYDYFGELIYDLLLKEMVL